MSALLRLARTQQVAARHEQIGERAGHEQSMGVLVQSAAADPGEAEHPFDAKNACSALARTFDLVRFLARSASSTTPLWR